MKSWSGRAQLEGKTNMKTITPILGKIGEYPPLDLDALTEQDTVTLLCDLLRILYRSVSIEILPLSVRSITVLRRMKVETVGDIFCLSVTDISGCRGLGPKVREEIRESVLSWCGLQMTNWDERSFGRVRCNAGWR